MSARELVARITHMMMNKGYIFNREKIQVVQAEREAEKQKRLDDEVMSKAKEFWAGQNK